MLPSLFPIGRQVLFHRPSAMATTTLALKFYHAVVVVVCGDLFAGFDISQRHIAAIDDVGVVVTRMIHKPLRLLHDNDLLAHNI